MREFLKPYGNLLLADDDSDDRDLFVEALSFIDPTIIVTVKRDGEELMEYLDQNSPTIDAIFLDLNMPRKNGRECLVELRANPRYRGIPIIIYTTSLNPIDIEETFKHGATFFLRKPNSFEELKETLNAMLLSGFKHPGERSKDNFVIKGALNLAQ